MWREIAEITWLIMIVFAALLVAYYVYDKSWLAAVFVFLVIFFAGAVGGYRIFEARERMLPELERKE